jgi:3D (Asp-Asp-Asp) domain-containing protein
MRLKKFNIKVLIVSMIYWGLIAPIYLYSQSDIKEDSNKIVTNSVKPIFYTFANKQELTNRSMTNTPTCSPIDRQTDRPKPTFKPTDKPLRKPTTTKPVDKSIQINMSSSSKFRVSAYDLTYSPKNEHITASGFNLSGKSRTDAMIIAADPRVIKMGTKVYLEFINQKVSKYNGIYTVRDTGGAIKGKKLDLYMGHSAYKECMNFGVQYANLKIIN